MKKVSVIVPVYNVEKYLSRCLESLINQSLKDIEIICINDGSADNSLQILKQFAYKDNRIKIINQTNSGQSVARNKGLAIASGKYIGFVDSDDWIDNDYYEKMFETIERTNSDFACCSIKRMYPYKQSKRLEITKEEIICNLNDKFKYLNMPSQCFSVNKLYKRELLNKFEIRFIEGRYFEDIPFLLNIVLNFEQMVSVPNITYYYWANPNSTMKKQDNIKRQDFIWAWDYMLEFCRNNNIKLNNKYQIKRKYRYSFLGITILKIYEWETEKHYLLFGILPVMKKFVS